MNTKVKNIIFAIIIFLQFSYVNLSAEEVKSVDDEELPATDPFLGSATVTESIVETDSSAGDIMNNMRLIATIICDCTLFYGASSSFSKISCGMTSNIPIIFIF